MGRKGLSRQEKLERMLELLYETKDVYTLKELEKTCHKSKGIVRQSVKEIGEELAADGIIMLDKIGSSNYYWAFPSQALAVRERRTAVLQEELDTLKRQRSELEAEEAEAYVGREETEERAAKLQRMTELEEEATALQTEVNRYAANDPEMIAAMESDLKDATEAVNRWTDNIFMLRSFCQKKFNMEPSRFDQGLGVPADLDYIE